MKQLEATFPNPPCTSDPRIAGYRHERGPWIELLVAPVSTGLNGYARLTCCNIECCSVTLFMRERGAWQATSLQRRPSQSRSQSTPQTTCASQAIDGSCHVPPPAFLCSARSSPLRTEQRSTAWRASAMCGKAETPNLSGPCATVQPSRIMTEFLKVHIAIMSYIPQSPNLSGSSMISSPPC